MRIAILNKYQNIVYRGAETFVYELSKRLAKNHEVDVIADINYLRLLTKKYDVIIPTNGRWQVIITRKIAWLSGAKMIVSGQSGVGWDDRINLYAFPDAFAALSSKALDWAKKVNPFVRSMYIPNGVDLEKFNTPRDKMHTAPRDKKKTILAVGAFTEQKRLNLAIEAVSKLDNVNLVIVGGGGDIKDKIRDLGINKLGERRFKLLSVPFEKMPEVYRAADVFTLPSRPTESFGNVLVEAMATNLPVVATEDLIRREIVGEAGILVDPTDINAYADALKKVLGSEWGDKPRKQAEKFSWDEIANKYEELFKKIIK